MKNVSHLCGSQEWLCKPAKNTDGCDTSCWCLKVFDMSEQRILWTKTIHTWTERKGVHLSNYTNNQEQLSSNSNSDNDSAVTLEKHFCFIRYKTPLITDTYSCCVTSLLILMLQFSPISMRILKVKSVTFAKITADERKCESYALFINDLSGMRNRLL